MLNYDMLWFVFSGVFVWCQASPSLSEVVPVPTAFVFPREIQASQFPSGISELSVKILGFRFFPTVPGSLSFKVTPITQTC